MLDNTMHFPFEKMGFILFPKRKIPVQFGVGSPSLILLDLSWIFPYLSSDFLQFPKVSRENLGKAYFQVKTSPLIQLTNILSQSIKKSKFKGLVRGIDGK